MATQTGHKAEVFSAAFSSDGARLVTASLDNTARVWDTATGQELATLTGHKNRVIAATFSPDGTRLLTASTDSTARIWDVSNVLNTTTAIIKELATLTGHQNGVTAGEHTDACKQGCSGACRISKVGG